MNISKDAFVFLKDLEKNNNRDWFNERKPIFEKHQAQVKLFFKEVQTKLEETDQIEGHKVYRIYRDVRFSKDKTPFKTNFSGSFKRATAELRGGYFLNIQPGKSAVGGGFYGPNADDLKRIRTEFEMDDTEIREILNNKNFKTCFGTLKGEGVKTTPRGFDPGHKAMDLIKKKQFYAMRSFTDKEVCDPQFINQVNETFLALRPFFDYMSSVLTTNLNGESILA